MVMMIRKLRCNSFNSIGCTCSYFDTNVGHDYLQDYQERYDFYHQTEEKIPFDLEFFNKITKGGLPNKTLNIALAATGVGKSLFIRVTYACILSLTR